MDYIILNQKKHDSYRYEDFVDFEDRIFFIEIETLNIPHDFTRYKCKTYIFKISNFNFDELASYILKLKSEFKISDMRIVCIQEKYLDICGQLRMFFKIPGFQGEGLTIFRNKLEMKRKASQGGLTVAKVLNYKKSLSYLEISNNLGSKFIIKPIDGMGSLNTYKIEDNDQFISLLKSNKIDESYICEEFITGKPGCIDCIVIDGEIKYEQSILYSIDSLSSLTSTCFGTMPISVKDNFYERIKNFNKSIVDAFNPENAVMHSEFFIRDNDIVFLETAIRPPGYNNVLIHSYMNSVDFLRTAIAIEMEKIHKLNIISKFSGEFYISIHFAALGTIACKIPSKKYKSKIKEIKYNIKPGRICNLSKDTGHYNSYILLSSSNYDDILHDFNSLNL